MNKEELNFELHRLECGHKWCGSHGFVFHPEKTGGLNIQFGRLHIWGCCVNIRVDLPAAYAMLRALPDGAGHKGVCDTFREMVGLPEHPNCMHRNGNLASLTPAISARS